MEKEKKAELKDSPYREMFENQLRALNDKQITNDLLMTLFDQSVEQMILTATSDKVKQQAKRIEELEDGLSKLIGSKCSHDPKTVLEFIKGYENVYDVAVQAKLLKTKQQ